MRTPLQLGSGSKPEFKSETDRYRESLRRLFDLRRRGIAGAVYTQTTDVEGEINGLMTYDRRRVKIPAAELKNLSAPLFEQ
jgi:beta-galactosidase